MAKNKDGMRVSVKKVRDRMILFYTILILIVFFAGTGYLMSYMKRVTSQRIAEQSRSLAMRTAAGVNSFCHNAESDCNRVFRSETVMDFDPVGKNYPEYESTAVRNEIKDELLELAAGRNYNDFFMIYSDGSTIGKVSYSADDFLFKRQTDSFTLLADERSDAWIFSPSGSTRKIYYIRRVTDHSYFIMSCYIDELDPFIKSMETISETGGSMVILAAEDDKVITSNTGADSSGSYTPSNCMAMFGKGSEMLLTDEYIGSVVVTDCGWRVFAVTENPLTFKDKTIVYGAVVVTAFLLILLSIVAGVTAAAKFGHSELAGGNEFTDPMTGRLNEYGLDENVSELLETSLVGSTYAFIMIGVTDTELLRSAVSISFRREICCALADTAEKFFKDRKYYIGRTSGDRIVVFADFSEFDLFKAHETLERECTALSREYEGFAAGSDSALRLHVGIGVSIYPDHAEDYDGLLEKADEAFRTAVSSDGGTVIYSA